MDVDTHDVDPRQKAVSSAAPTQASRSMTGPSQDLKHDQDIHHMRSQSQIIATSTKRLQHMSTVNLDTLPPELLHRIAYSLTPSDLPAFAESFLRGLGCTIGMLRYHGAQYIDEYYSNDQFGTLFEVAGTPDIIRGALVKCMRPEAGARVERHWNTSGGDMLDQLIASEPMRVPEAMNRLVTYAVEQNHIADIGPLYRLAVELGMTERQPDFVENLMTSMATHSRPGMVIRMLHDGLIGVDDVFPSFFAAASVGKADYILTLAPVISYIGAANFEAAMLRVAEVGAEIGAVHVVQAVIETAPKADMEVLKQLLKAAEINWDRQWRNHLEAVIAAG